MTLIVLKTTLAAAAGLIAARALGRAPASVRHFVLASTFAAMAVLPIAGAVMSPHTVHVPITTTSRPAPAQVTTAVAALAPTVESSSPAPVDQSLKVSTTTLVVSMWVAGAVFCLAVLCAGVVTLCRLRRTGLPWLEGRAVVDGIARRAGVDRPVELILHEQVSAPMTFGVSPPIIVLPADAQGWPSPALERAIVHELEHIRRHDWPVQLAARIVCAVYWFNPLVWMAGRELSLEAERACDDAVIAREEATDYARQLVALARRLAGRPQPGLAMAAPSDLSRRVAALLDARQARGRPGRIALTVAVAVAVAIVVTMAPVRVAAAIVHADGTGEQQRAGGSPGSRGDRALVEASEEGDLDEVKWLLDAGANANATVDGDGSPLIVAAREGHLAVVTLLLSVGADPNLGVEGDGNPLIMAAREGHFEIVGLLLDRGASIDRVVPGDENALIQASGAGRLAVVKMLVERGADVNARVWAEAAYERPDGEWRTPLGQARRGGHRDVEALLVAAGARE
jgi:beta-lactamase regulating signal transducer with metallopeptidase domain